MTTRSFCWISLPVFDGEFSLVVLAFSDDYIILDAILYSVDPSWVLWAFSMMEWSSTLSIEMSCYLDMVTFYVVTI